ncbi:MAG: tRNA (adenosine(37)-N6)-threonylcarbamoyltransferase complex dimerization subunit type 1 TsaB [Bdellovibrionales bacterium]|nr:tRNA (adenosine(37)-N6)-threonylcarbamoyltransferase complex dimerization subunit type 1 TsaB [Bdellovibrionales bacterium]
MRLAIDTSTFTTYVALEAAPGSHCLATDDTSGSAESLIPLIREVCLQAGAQSRDIRELVVAAGPGSFTGLRTGIATAQGFAAGVGAQVTALSIFIARAFSALPQSAVALVTVSAAPGERYCCLLERSTTGAITILSEMSYVAQAELAALQAGYQDELRKPIELLDVDPSALSGTPAVALLLCKPTKVIDSFGGHQQQSSGVSALDVQYIKPVQAKTIAERLAASAG